MSADFRISTNFFTHYKTRKLKKRLGLKGVFALLQLWAFAAEERTDGNLSDMSIEDIELVVDWSGKSGAFVSTLVEVGFLDEEDGDYFIHDWVENNPWAAGTLNRKDQSRFSRMAKLMPKEYQILSKAGIKGISKRDYEALKNADDTSTVLQRIINTNGSGAQATVNESQTNEKRNDNGQLTDVQRSLNGSSDARQTVVNDTSDGRSTKRQRILTPSPSVFQEEKKERDTPLPPTGGEGGAPARQAPPQPPEEPGLDFVELREFYSAHFRDEGRLAGYQEFRQAKAGSHWPGFGKIYEHLKARLDAQSWQTGYAPSLGRFLREQMWLDPVRPRASPAKPAQRAARRPGEFDEERQRQIMRDVLVEMEAEDARRNGTGTQARGAVRTGPQLRQGIPQPARKALDAAPGILHG